jgi:hypothetical protein
MKGKASFLALEKRRAPTATANSSKSMARGSLPKITNLLTRFD